MCAGASSPSSAGLKTVGGMRKTRFRGLERVSLHFTMVAIAFNLVRVARLGGRMAVLRPEFRKWSENTAKAGKIGMVTAAIRPFSTDLFAIILFLQFFSTAS